jgi:hypothetical protein
MILHARVHDTEATKFTSKKGGGDVLQQSYTLLDIGEGAKMKQMIELNLAVDAPKLAVGSEVIIEVTEISSIFAGRPRIRGAVKQAATTPKRQ